MFQAVVFAFADSVNALLIAVIVAVGIMLPRGQYRRIVSLLLVGDWLGVFLLALGVMYIFVGLQDFVTKLLESPVFGIILIAVAVITAIGAWRSKPGDGTNPIVVRLLKPLQEPSFYTFLTGFVLGVVQSATSAPYFGGIAVLAAGDFSNPVRYVAMIFYATIALSLSTLVAAFVAIVRARPHSAAGRVFAWARQHSYEVSKISAYGVAAFLGGLGLFYL